MPRRPPRAEGTAVAEPDAATACPNCGRDVEDARDRTVTRRRLSATEPSKEDELGQQTFTLCPCGYVWAASAKEA